MEAKALGGVKVVDFTWSIAGPMAISYLADLGAEVVKIESLHHLDGMRRTIPFKDNIPHQEASYSYAEYNRNKYGITLDLHHPQGLQIAKRLIARADVVAENFSAGVIKKLGLGYEELVKIKPDIVMISLSAMGQFGPHHRHPSIGSQLVGTAGIAHLCGWADRDPAFIYGAYTDFIGPRPGAAIMLAALDYRRRTGKGQYLDLSQLECAVNYVAPLVLDYTVNGRETNRAGNDCPHAAPHAAYRCQGEDRWCAIAVFSDEEWQSFCRAIGNPAWTGDARFATAPDRKANEADINRLIEEWTMNLPAEEVMTRMQAAGVAAGVVQAASDLFSDPQLGHRNHFWQFDHTKIGRHSLDSPSFRLSKTPARAQRPAPLQGEHNEYVCTSLLGMSDDEFVQVLADGAFGQV